MNTKHNLEKILKYANVIEEKMKNFMQDIEEGKTPRMSDLTISKGFAQKIIARAKNTLETPKK